MKNEDDGHLIMTMVKPMAKNGNHWYDIQEGSFFKYSYPI